MSTSHRLGRLSRRLCTLHVSRLAPQVTLALLVELVTRAVGCACLTAAALLEGSAGPGAAARFALLELATPALARYAAAMLDGTLLCGQALCIAPSAPSGASSAGCDLVVRPIAEGIDACALAHLFCLGTGAQRALPSVRLGVGGGAGAAPLAFVTLPSLPEALRAVQLFHGACSLGGSVLSVELARRHEAAATPQHWARAWEALGGGAAPLALPRLPTPPRLPPLLESAEEARQLLAAAGAVLCVDEQFARLLLLEAVGAAARRIERGLVAAARARMAEAEAAEAEAEEAIGQ